jgi:chromosome segregation and condensation protein ScpB
MQVSELQVPGLCDQLNTQLDGHGLHIVQLRSGYAIVTRPEQHDVIASILDITDSESL